MSNPFTSKPDSLHEAASKALNEAQEYFMIVQEKFPHIRLIEYSVKHSIQNDKDIPKKLTKAGADKVLQGDLNYYGGLMKLPWEGVPGKKSKVKIEEAAKPVPSIHDPIWDISFDKKTIETNLTWNDIVAKATRKLPGSKVITDTFTMMDLKNGDQKELIFNAGRKGSIRIRMQLHPMNAKQLKKEADSFGSIK